MLAALEILTRMCRHSVEMAESVREYPRLMDVILQNFLPSNWSSMCKLLSCHFLEAFKVFISV